MELPPLELLSEGVLVGSAVGVGVGVTVVSGAVTFRHSPLYF
ncbi:hypothetical protein [Anaerocolumna jejuensis]|nr:hypothetical protein [Anaerocolumna jejuensis]